jgi:hypothetical protein
MSAKPSKRQILVALAGMYIQYCGGRLGHDFMSAGEDAIEILEAYGLGNEYAGIDEVVLDKFERGIDPINKTNKEKQNERHTKSDKAR